MSLSARCRARPRGAVVKMASGRLSCASRVAGESRPVRTAASWTAKAGGPAGGRSRGNRSESEKRAGWSLSTLVDLNEAIKTVLFGDGS